MSLRSIIAIVVSAALIVGGMVYAAKAGLLAATYEGAASAAGRVADILTNASSSAPVPSGYTFPEDFGATGDVRAIYATVGTIRDADKRAALIKLLDDTTLNAIVVDAGSSSAIYLDDTMRAAVAELRTHNIYPIVRIPVFQHDGYARAHPEVALKTADGALWGERGRYWVDPASKQVWDYVLDLSSQSIDMGFAEINLDYVRFPSDGALDAAKYPVYDGVTSKDLVMEKFFTYFHDTLKAKYPKVTISADVFGYAFLSDSDVGIGQRIRMIAPHVDVLAPMTYPSHYSTGNFGFESPAAHPYEVVKQTLALGKKVLSVVPVDQRPVIRPWIQDFDMGATYTRELVQAQMRATYDVGGRGGWMVWNPSNVYVLEKYIGLPEPPKLSTTSTSTAQ